MEKRFKYVEKKYERFVANINAVHEHVDAKRLSMMFEKFTRDPVFIDS